MKSKASVAWSTQVEEYVKALAPEPRRMLWRSIKGLANWNGKEGPPRIRHLEDNLAGYSRLRAGRHRVVFREKAISNKRTILCLFAGPRSTVYELFAEILLDELASTEEAEE